MSSLGWYHEIIHSDVSLNGNRSDAAKQRRFNAGQSPAVLFHEHGSLGIHEFLQSMRAYDPHEWLPLASLRSARGATHSSVFRARFARDTPEIVLFI